MSTKVKKILAFIPLVNMVYIMITFFSVRVWEETKDWIKDILQMFGAFFVIGLLRMPLLALQNEIVTSVSGWVMTYLMSVAMALIVVRATDRPRKKQMEQRRHQELNDRQSSDDK
ncbi:MAG: hypothetical protein IKC32_02860 [Clostridia bacterium]|nr:hypothetical protein [Clostridia bacterium]